MPYRASVNVHSVDPKITSALFRCFPNYRGEKQARMTFGYPSYGLPNTCALVETIRAICEEVLKERNDLVVDYFLEFEIEIWEKEPGYWNTSKSKPRNLPNFPACTMHAIDFISSGKLAEVEITRDDHVIDPETTHGSNHFRSIIVKKTLWRTATKDDIAGMMDLLGDERNIDKVFACFDALS
jgi:hypothetical protein